MKIDDIDKKLLAEIQADSSLALEALGERVGLSRNACWRRIKSLEASGVITRRVALLSPELLGKALTVFVHIRAGSADPKWHKAFRKAISKVDEIQSVFRLSGDYDYLLRMQVADMDDYDRVRGGILKSASIKKIKADFVLETMKDTTALPL